jgi:oligopeptide transport system substrate-binding protein
VKRSKKALGFIALAAASALVLSGCSSSGEGSGGGAAGSGIITVNNTEPQKGLVPADTTEVGGGKVVDALWEGLVYYDADGVTQMGVAESIESDDQVNWTVKLRDDAVFSDGTPVLAKNFVDAWNYAANVDNAMGNQYFFSVIEGFSETEPVEAMSGLKVVDDHTFTVAATPDFPDRLGYSARTRSATASTSSTATTPGSTTSRSSS